jgi:general secretion pathway protein D
VLLVSGCATPPAPRPIEMPQPPAIVAEAERAQAQVRSTIVGGEAPVPQTPATGVRPPAPGNVSVTLPDADVGVVAQSVAELVGRPIAVDPGVTGRVSLVTPAPVARSAILGLFEAALRTANLALVPVGDGFAVQTVATAQARGPVTVDSLGFGTEVVKLEFINAAELRTVLDGALPGVVTATDPASNSITIAGTTGQRAGARGLVREFDVNWLRNMSFALFVPERTDSRLIAPELEKLINANDAPTRGLVRLIQMERINGILAVSAQRQYLEDVRRWLEILDREGESAEPKLFVYRVQNGRARDLARTLNNAFGSDGGNDAAANADPFANAEQAFGPNGETSLPGSRPPATPVPPAPGAAPANDQQPANAGPPPLQQTRITSDDVNNAVIVYGTPKEYAVVEDALRKLDILPTQVMIEAAITEVSLTDDLRFGVQWNYITGDSNFTLTEGTTSTPTRNLPGFSYFLTGRDITAALNALEERTNIKVVSAPKLLVLNNQTAALQVGDQVPIQTQQQQSTDGGNAPIINSIEYRDTGVILKVTPRVNAGGLVLLDVAQEVSSVGATPQNGSPTIATRRVSTSVAVQDGQVIALGGLFRDSQSFGKNGLPLLSRIPILGSLLFGNTKNMQMRTELIILLKPHVIRSGDDARAITEELRRKIRTLEPFRTEGRIP